MAKLSPSQILENQSPEHPPAELGRLGDLVVKIAETPAEIEAALRLRHRVFGQTVSDGHLTGRDEDRFDAHCDHLIVLDMAAPGEQPRVVATYRLLGQDVSRLAGGFYTRNEFRIDDLVARHPDMRFLEFGRSCVLPQYRSKRTIELLWHGSWAYVRRHGYDVMFGCASFAGTNPAEHEKALAFLAANARADAAWNVAGIGEVVAMEASANDPAEMKTALKALPPLIKGYLRLGAMFADEAVIDRAFGTLDVLVLLPVSRLNPRYVKYYGADAARHAL